MPNFQAFSQALFLMFVVILAVFLLHTNKQPVQKEHFAQEKPKSKQEPKPKQKKFSLKAQIQDIYQELYGAKPNDQELTFYTHFFANKDQDINYMREIISTSAPTLQKTLKVGTQLETVVHGTEDEVVAIFNEILDRNPDVQELQYYAAYTKQGPQYIERMKILLLGSPEYKRLQKLQKNTAYGQLLGGVTQRQLTIMVTSIWDELTSKSVPLDDETLSFLKKKYLDFELNEPVFRTFVREYVLFDLKSIKSQKATTTTVGKAVAKQGGTSVNANGVTGTSGTSGTTANKNTTNTTSTTSTPNKVTEQLKQKAFSCAENKVNTQQVIQQIKQNAQCQFDKNATNSQQSQALAKTVAERNRDELKNICQRNNSFKKFHYDDLTILPGQQWSVPQRHPPVCTGSKGNYSPRTDQTALIGTLLKDASDTEVGSIMPKFVYQEYVD